MTKTYTVDSIIWNLIRLYPGMNSQIFEMAAAARRDGENEGLDGTELADYVWAEVTDRLD